MLSHDRPLTPSSSLHSLPPIHQWIYTRTEKRTLRREARYATLLDQMSVRDYVASYLEDPAMKRQFMRQVCKEGGREGGRDALSYGVNSPLLVMLFIGLA